MSTSSYTSSGGNSTSFNSSVNQPILGSKGQDQNTIDLYKTANEFLNELETSFNSKMDEFETSNKQGEDISVVSSSISPNSSKILLGCEKGNGPKPGPPSHSTPLNNPSTSESHSTPNNLDESKHTKRRHGKNKCRKEALKDLSLLFPGERSLVECIRQDWNQRHSELLRRREFEEVVYLRRDVDKLKEDVKFLKAQLALRDLQEEENSKVNSDKNWDLERNIDMSDLLRAQKWPMGDVIDDAIKRKILREQQDLANSKMNSGKTWNLERNVDLDDFQRSQKWPMVDDEPMERKNFLNEQQDRANSQMDSETTWNLERPLDMAGLLRAEKWPMVDDSMKQKLLCDQQDQFQANPMVRPEKTLNLWRNLDRPDLNRPGYTNRPSLDEQMRNFPSSQTRDNRSWQKEEFNQFMYIPDRVVSARADSAEYVRFNSEWDDLRATLSNARGVDDLHAVSNNNHKRSKNRKKRSSYRNDYKNSENKRFRDCAPNDLRNNIRNNAQ